jgi:ribosomal protein S18 acetylase RimI-like enzyme
MRFLHYDYSAVSGENQGVIRPARREDLKDIVAVHETAFPNSFLTQLGRGFLRKYYALVISYRGGILLVKGGRASRVEGFVCGFVNPEGFYGRMSQRKGLFVWPILSALLRRPSLAGRIIHSVQRVKRHRARTVTCELSSLAVRPELSGRGTGKALVGAFIERAWSLGAQQVALQTDANNSEPANALYRRVGFQLSRRFQRQKGRWMNEYVIDLPLGSDI